MATVFAFLGITPGYNEYELSNWFLVYLSIFFAMIFAVYPLWCLLAALVVGPGPAPSRLAAAREATGRA